MVRLLLWKVFFDLFEGNKDYVDFGRVLRVGGGGRVGVESRDGRRFEIGKQFLQSPSLSN